MYNVSSVSNASVPLGNCVEDDKSSRNFHGSETSLVEEKKMEDELHETKSQISLSSDVLLSLHSQQGVEGSLPFDECYEISSQNRERCHIYSREMYDQLYWRSLNDSENFWGEMAEEHLRWLHKFTKITSGSFGEGETCWFLNGKLNVCDNCVDRWAEQFPERTAIIWEGDEPSNAGRVSYSQLLTKVCKFANLLKYLGVKKSDIVTIYMPMMPEVIYAMLACARIGAVHNVVFAGLSAASLRDRIVNSNSEVVITADHSTRGGKLIPLKEIADEAMKECVVVKKCIVFKHLGSHFKHLGKPINFISGRDVWGDESLDSMRPYCPLEHMDSEDCLFVLYTSGSTGKPKGISHTSGGYLLYAALTHKWVFDVHPGDVFACVADVGWITGHSYVVYGPLCNGTTTFLFESVPTYPNPGRYWSIVEKYGVTQFYTAPTAIRALMRHGESWPEKYDLSSLRVIGSVGETINPEAWRWYYKYVGRSKCSIVDTYWQTETGGHVLTPFPGAIRPKPGCSTLPFFGIEPVILDIRSGEELDGGDVYGVLCFKRSWPGMFRTINGEHHQMLRIYFHPYPGYYFTGDGAVRDNDGYYWITGRVDDTLNVSGHRLGTAEIENALMRNSKVAEAAVVGFPHDVKGNGIFCFVCLKEEYANRTNNDGLLTEIKQSVRSYIGPIATPDAILITRCLPKTSSGKIMRRVLRKIASFDYDVLEDTPTMIDPSIINEIKRNAEILLQQC